MVDKVKTSTKIRASIGDIADPKGDRAEGNSMISYTQS